MTKPGGGQKPAISAEALIAASSDAILAVSLTRERMFGFQAEEAVGRSLIDLLHPADSRGRVRWVPRQAEVAAFLKDFP